MKASELIKLLEENIKEHGDKDVVIVDMAGDPQTEVKIDYIERWDNFTIYE